MVLHITKDNFEKEIKQSKTPVIVDFWAEWCGPCKMMGPVFEEISKDYAGKLKFVKVDTDKEHDVAENFDISGIPTLIVLNKGEEVDRIVGFAPKPMLKQKIDEILRKIK